jgi:hypothetical protein
MRTYKKVFIILVAYILFKEASAMGIFRKNPQPPPKEIPEVVVTPVESSGPVKVYANIEGEMRDADRIARIQALVPVLEKVINSPQLEKRILAAWYDGKPGFQDTQDSPAQALLKLRESDWLLSYEFANNRSSVTGWTYPSTQTVWFNRKNFDGRVDCGIVGTMAHEKSHKLGYFHKNSKRNLSLPYYLGTQASQVCEELK